MRIEIPYGTASQILTVPDGLDAEVLRSGAHGAARTKSEDALVLEAMAAPIASPRLSELAKGKRNITVICSDHTRPVPSRRIIPHMLAELRAGNPEAEITLLIATGCHRPTTREELIQKFGPEIVERERIVVHDCTDESALVQIGTLPSGAPLVINRLAAQADLLVSEGFIEPHFFAGYSGGRKSVLPGVCGRRTVLGNHCAAFIDSPDARTSILRGNPIHRDMAAAAEMAKLAFIVNVIINGSKQVTAAFAGHPEHAHAAGCEHLQRLCRVTPARPADIVVTSNGGAPLDQNIYQAVKGLTAAEAAAAPGAVLIIASACADGSGGDEFHHMLRDCESPTQLLEQIRRVPMDQTRPDQWQAQILARILSKHRVILVCEPGARPIAEQMKLETAAGVDEAFSMALSRKGTSAHITVIPDGVSVVVQAELAGTSRV